MLHINTHTHTPSLLTSTHMLSKTPINAHATPHGHLERHGQKQRKKSILKSNVLWFFHGRHMLTPIPSPSIHHISVSSRLRFRQSGLKDRRTNNYATA